MATHLTPTEMKALVREHFEDFVNNQLPGVIRQNMTADFIDHDGPNGQMVGVEEDEQMMRRMYELLPGTRVSIVDMVAEGDRVVCRNVWRWTEATSGARMEFHGFVQWRFEGDRIAERWATVTPPHSSPEPRAGAGPGWDLTADE